MDSKWNRIVNGMSYLMLPGHLWPFICNRFNLNNVKKQTNIKDNLNEDKYKYNE